MIKRITVISVLTFLIFAVGCNTPSNKDKSENKKKEVQVKTKKIVEEGKVLIEQEQQEAIASLETERDHIKVKLDELKSKFEKQSANTQNKTEQAIKDLENQGAELDQALETLKNTTKEEFEETRKEVDSRIDNLTKDIKETWDSIEKQ